MKLLEGEIEQDYRDAARIAELEQEVRDLTDELSHAKFALAEAQRQSNRALGTLRRQLSPLYRALKDVFGELDAAGVEDARTEPEQPTVNARTAKVWQSWKERLGEGPGKVIDALLLHTEMTTQQLSIATGYHRTSIPALIFKLNRAGLLNKSGGKFSLKQL